MFFTDAGPRSGPILWNPDLRPIDVRAAPDAGTTVGSATPVGATDGGGIAIWDITFRGGAGPAGRWIVVGREFRPRK